MTVTILLSAAKSSTSLWQRRGTISIVNTTTSRWYHHRCHFADLSLLPAQQSAATFRSPSPSSFSLPFSSFSTGSGRGGKYDGADGSSSDNPKKNRSGLDDTAGNSKVNIEDDDPFGVNYVDNPPESRRFPGAASLASNVGPEDALPPRYIRDPTTGKLTGRVEHEIPRGQRRLLDLDDAEADELLTKRLMESFGNNDDDDIDDGGSGENKDNTRMVDIAMRIREERMAVNTLGRSVADITSSLASEKRYDTTTNDNDEDKDRDDEDYQKLHPFSTPLSAEEFDTLESFVRKTSSESGRVAAAADAILAEAEDIIPVVRRRSTAKDASDHQGSNDIQHKHKNNKDSNLEWMTAPAQRSMDGMDEGTYDPFADLLPSDLNPSRKVNRKNAKSPPSKIMYHCNLSLLRRYVTPGGQIMNRAQSRLGAKDQRKIARMIKRARHLGLIPHVGQWRVEDHGDVKEKDIHKDRPWEKELKKRGLR